MMLFIVLIINCAPAMLSEASILSVRVCLSVCLFVGLRKNWKITY